jgi:hypothetical protein
VEARPDAYESVEKPKSGLLLNHWREDLPQFRATWQPLRESFIKEVWPLRSDEEATMIKSLSALMLAVAMAAFALAQRAQNNTDEKLSARNAPDVFIFSASAFGPDKNGDSHFTVEVGNTGAKTITNIEWEYDPSRDVGASGVRGRLMFRSDALGLQTNQRRKLTQQIHHYTDGFVKSFHLDTVRILRVDYEDGSSWRRLADR